ncbi:lipase-like PAD4 [Syzygium oleosum]|uniref:lipase-like PAD4 n=1 Tax=Syzygium oleosum TaxID=219896 RepID=UPI0011D2B97E|nr:lipase-like PAD4 [Syzygium oleosum]
MDTEASPFETSKMLGTFLASMPLLEEAWRLCSTANAMGPGAFVVEQVGGVGYVAFSGIQEMPVLGLDPSYGMLAPLDAADHGLFAPLTCRSDGEEPVIVHSGVLRLFRDFHSRPDFQSQIDSLLENTNSIVITGHSIGGSIAFLAALGLLSKLKSIFPPVSVLCIGFGSPFLGNESLSRAILRERWGGSFYNIVSTHDIMPRLSLDQLLVQTHQWHYLLKFWHMSMMSPNSMNLANLQLTEEDKAWLFSFVVADMERQVQAGEGSGGRSFWPLGNYLFFSDEGAICLDNAVSINKMMHLMLWTGSPNCIVEEHLKYGCYVERLTHQSLKRSFMEGDLSESSYEASLSLALNSSETYRQVLIAPMAKDCLKMTRRMGRTPNLNAADLAIRLSKITPYRVEIEWYKASCDESNEQRGYYDSFKQRGASRTGSHVNMNRYKLAAFWDKVICMMDGKELPHDLLRSSKWVNAAQSYMLLVEPLDIADYYRSGMRLKKGHYISKGRERRYKIFDQWWTEKVVTEKLSNRRTRYAGLTQDACFWARVEEAKEWLDNIRSRSDPRHLAFLWDRLDKFETYAVKLVEGKEVSADVVAKNSSFNLWLGEWRASKSQIYSLISIDCTSKGIEECTIDMGSSSPAGRQGAVPFGSGSLASMAMEEPPSRDLEDRHPHGHRTGGEAEISVNICCDLM